MLHWTLGPHLSSFADPVRGEMAEFLMSISLALMQRSSSYLGARTPSGELAAVAVVQRLKRPPKTGIVDGFRILAHLVALYVRGALPELYRRKAHAERKRLVNPGLMKRADVMMKELERMHAAHAPADHLFVFVMATDPPAQGSGYCSQVMRAVERAADAEGLPAYLEAASERTRAIYERFGFEVVGSYTMAVEPADPDEGWPPCGPVYAMVRSVGASPARS